MKLSEEQILAVQNLQAALGTFRELGLDRLLAYVDTEGTEEGFGFDDEDCQSYFYPTVERLKDDLAGLL